MSPEDARPFLLGLLETLEKTDLVFTEVVISRSTVVCKENGETEHGIFTWSTKKLSADQFSKVSQYPSKLSNSDWLKYMDGICPTQIVDMRS